MLHQTFITAYELHKRPGLRTAFEDYVATNSGSADRMATCIGDYPEAIATACAELSESEKLVLKWLAFAYAVARYFEAHLREKASGFGFDPQFAAAGPRPRGVEQDRRRALAHFLKCLYSESVFNPEEELEVQFAISGSFAAHLHADYASTELQRP